MAKRTKSATQVSFSVDRTAAFYLTERGYWEQINVEHAEQMIASGRAIETNG